MIMILSMEWGYVSELRPPTGLLFIPRWYMSMKIHGGIISTGENSWFVHHNSLAILPAQPSSSKAEGTGGGNDEFFLTKYLFHTSKVSLTCLKYYDMGPTALLPLRRKACCGFLLPSSEFEQENLGSNGKYTNHQTRLAQHTTRGPLAPPPPNHEFPLARERIFLFI
jgi:hypothetical protein